jgi:thiosulfate/3-mercaptopyruvate sulfurtransferase
MQYRDPSAIVETGWLERHLDDPRLRTFDCTLYLRPAAPDEGVPYHPESGRTDYEKAHIPNAAFLDLAGELSDPDSPYFFMMPSQARFVAAMESNGIGEGLRAVLYSAGSIMWATRVWWMLRAYGFDAAVLDGGIDKWRREGRPLASGAVAFPRARFVARPRPGLFTDRDGVLAALGDGRTLLVNALADEYFRGEKPSRYGRPGRIPGSVSVPAAKLLAPEDQTFVAPEVAKARFEAAGVDRAERVIAYCGGGISATVDLFLLHQLGHDQLSLYDASMGEWARDERLPIERG